MPRNPNQRELAGFLLGLGIGLIVGIVFQPRDDQSVTARGVDQLNRQVMQRAAMPRTAVG